MQSYGFILVTGGLGFIGHHTVVRFLAQNCRVRVLDNLSTGCRENLPENALNNPNLEIIEGDIRDFASCTHAMDGVDAVLHLAAQVSVPKSIEDPVKSAETNVSGFLNILDAARQKEKMPRIVYASSAATYGATEGACEETAKATALSPYGLEKQLNEEYAKLYQNLYGLQTMGLRYFNVYGPGQDPASDYAGVLAKFAGQITDGTPLTIFGDGEQTRDFVFVKDVAAANYNAIQSDATGVSNIASGKSVTLNQLIDTIEDILNSTVERAYKAPRAGDIKHSTADMGKAREFLTSSTDLKSGLKDLLKTC